MSDDFIANGPVVIKGAVANLGNLESISFSLDGKNWVDIPKSLVTNSKVEKSNWKVNSQQFDLGTLTLAEPDTQLSKSLYTLIKIHQLDQRVVPWYP